MLEFSLFDYLTLLVLNNSLPFNFIGCMKSVDMPYLNFKFNSVIRKKYNDI